MMTIRKKMTDLAVSALISTLLGFTLAASFSALLGAALPPALAALVCAVTGCVCALMLLSRGTMIAALALIALSGVGLAVFRGRAVLDGLKELAVSVGDMLTGAREGLGGSGRQWALAASVILGAAAFWLVRMSGGVYPALLLTVFELLGGWFLEKQIPTAYLLPGLIALAAMYARAFREESALAKALPAAVLAAALTLCAAPREPVTWEPLRDCADKVRELFNDYFLFDDPRTVYSVSSDGYQPLTDRLGGPAEPRDEPVMTVETDEDLLLRGALSRTYTGVNWIDEAVNTRYLFIDPTRRSRRDAAFDVDQASALGGRLHEASARVTFEAEGTSTLFVPHRLTGLDIPLDYVTYYNDTGEVFMTRGVEPGDSYGLTALLLPQDLSRLTPVMTALDGGDDRDYAAAMADYTGLPASVENDLYWLTMSLTEGCAADWEKAMAIASYLGEGFAYTLDGAYPPEGRDFVSWFVLDEKKGYCTYYASAMAVMARLAGIPSRYAEGYRVKAGADGAAHVTGADAHAWAELYFPGAGWIPFDVTPGGEEGGTDSPDRPEAPTVTPAPSPTAIPGDGQTDGVVPPEAESTPTPAPPENRDALTDEPSPEPDEPSDDDQNEEPNEKPDSAPLSGKASKILLAALIVLLLLALAALLAVLCVRRRQPEYLALREKNARSRAALWYRASLCLLARSGLTPEGGDTPSAFARRLASTQDAPEGMEELAAAIERIQYSRNGSDSSAEMRGRAVYHALLARMSRRERLKWAFELMRHGIGDYKQIP